jgi:hypothetical protein
VGANPAVPQQPNVDILGALPTVPILEVNKEELSDSIFVEWIRSSPVVTRLGL